MRQSSIASIVSLYEERQSCTSHELTVDFSLTLILVNLRHLHFAPSISGLPSIKKTIDAIDAIDGEAPKLSLLDVESRQESFMSSMQSF